MPSIDKAAARSRTLATRTFSLADQEEFANLSGDHNPMHVDEVAARRLITGRPVVHGIHLLLYAIESWASQQSCRVVSLECNFDQAVSVGDMVTVEQRESAVGQWLLTASVSSLVCASITIHTSSEPAAPSPHAPNRVGVAEVQRRIDGVSAPLDEGPGSQQGKTMVLPLAVGVVDIKFPGAARVMGGPAITALAGLSYFVGMVCPGLHSVFSSLRLSVADEESGDDALGFTLRRHDPRFNLFIVSFTGCVQGELRAFRRPPPQTQLTTLELQQHVMAGEFGGTRALIVGGSRGLGEVTAKILAAGGAEVTISYASGKDDALQVAQDINSVGPGKCATIAIDLQQDNLQELNLEGEFDAVYYFATPRIYRKKAAVFDAAQFSDFCHFYLDQFQRLCQLLESRSKGRRVRVYLPSTVFILNRPKGMTEYTMAKAASEVLAEDLNRTLRHVQVLHTRLPRMATDQTTSVIGLESSSNVEVLLPIVRLMSQRSA